jgi:hypothetical protein
VQFTNECRREVVKILLLVRFKDGWVIGSNLGTLTYKVASSKRRVNIKEILSDPKKKKELIKQVIEFMRLIK